ncbi:hypothetical protein ASPCADRAFT_204740, partial [Aspergillus carbonarius ITEM 5010]
MTYLGSHRQYVYSLTCSGARNTTSCTLKTDIKMETQHHGPSCRALPRWQMPFLTDMQEGGRVSVNIF